MSFKTKLILYALTLVLILAIPLFYFEVQRPWQELNALIEKCEARLAGLECALEPGELSRMNRFALEMIEKLKPHQEEERPEDYYPLWANSQAFCLLMDQGRMPSEQEVLATFQEEGLEFQEFSYRDLERWYQFWRDELDKRPGLEAIFRKYRRILKKAHDDALQAGFQVADIYIMLDDLRGVSPFFRENVAHILESLSWWEASYPGEPYNLLESETEGWRASYDPKSGGGPGFHHNPVFDPDNWYLPGFDTDQWGTWFSSWMALETDLGEGGKVYNTLNIDFDAAIVKRLMINAGIDLAAITAAIFLILILATHRFSRWLTRPIAALTEGAEAVIDRRYEHVVPSFGKDEFFRLTEVFNRMIQWVKEMTNLKETLTKLLSEELAESAAKDGLTLGGREVECTIMFTDFAGFSTLTANIGASDVVDALNLYFGELIPIIKRRGGFPDKYIGDAIVAIFGAPVRYKNHAEQALRCAIELQKKMREINERRRRDGALVLEMRIGLNSGLVLAGAIGCDLKLEFTSIGETTNLANRMEMVCEIGQVLISENTYAMIRDQSFDDALITRTPEKINVKGYREPVNVYRVHVHDLKITKNMDARDSADFYRYEKTSPPGGRDDPQDRERP